MIAGRPGSADGNAIVEIAKLEMTHPTNRQLRLIGQPARSAQLERGRQRFRAGVDGFDYQLSGPFILSGDRKEPFRLADRFVMDELAVQITADARAAQFYLNVVPAISLHR